MMKKIIMLVCAVLMLAFSGIAFADGYPKYFKGDANFPLANARMGYAQYISKSSLNVEKYAPPKYIISVKYINVDNADRGGNKISSWGTARFYYDINKRAMYIDNGDTWKYLPPKGSVAESYMVPMGEMLFRQAYNMGFYR